MTVLRQKFRSEILHPQVMQTRCGMVRPVPVSIAMEPHLPADSTKSLFGRRQMVPKSGVQPAMVCRRRDPIHRVWIVFSVTVQWSMRDWVLSTGVFISMA